jgi:hypothetical protein
MVPFMHRVEIRLHVTGRLPAETESFIIRRLAARAAEVRWGTDAENAFIAANDPDIRVAMGAFDKARALLGP